MKEYIKPQVKLIELDTNDVITTSPGTDTTPKDENDGFWDMNL